MTNLLAHPVFRSRYPLAILAGVLWTCAFPKIGIAGLAWIAPGLMVAAALGKGGGEAFRIGYVAGLAHYLSMLYWLLLIPFRWNGIPLGPALGWVALSAFLALFTAVWVWAAVPRTSAARASVTEVPVGPPSETRGLSAVLELPVSWAGRLAWMLGAAAFWVGLEMILARIFGGFPWGLLGVSQYELVPLIQIASTTGVYGVSFLLVWASLALLSAGVMLIRRPGARAVWLGEIFLPILVGALLFNVGLRQLRHEAAPERNLRVLLVQPSIPQTLIWNPDLDTNRFNELVAYSDQLLTNKADLVVWPESALPRMLRYDTNTFNLITGLAQKHRVWMIVGSDDAEPKGGPGDAQEIDYFNSSFLISPEGMLIERYRKRNLVIFGEYIPLQHWFPFLRWFTPSQGGFTPGTGPVDFELRSLGVRTSVLICFEDIFPQLGRTGVKPETDFLVNITNDGWFGHSAAQWQHAMTALFRAVENRVPLVRCCNNGVTCWIDGRGRRRQILRDERGTVYGRGYLRAQIPILRHEEARSLTFYTRHGDVFGWSCAAVAGFFTALRFIAGKGRLQSRLPAVPR